MRENGFFLPWVNFDHILMLQENPSEPGIIILYRKEVIPPPGLTVLLVLFILHPLFQIVATDEIVIHKLQLINPFANVPMAA